MPTEQEQAARILEEWLGRRPPNRSAGGVPGLAAIVTDAGRVRSDNQDRAAIIWVPGEGTRAGFLCAAVCDGMGGMPGGEESAVTALANFLAVVTAERHLPADMRLETAIRQSDIAVNRLGLGGGSTLSALLLEGSRTFVANVGDSRVYGLHSPTSDVPLKKLTIDDTLRDAFGGDRNDLLQFVGMGRGISPHIRELSEKFESYCLTTDGVHRLGDELIASLYRSSEGILVFIRRLVDVANWTGGFDNATSISLSLTPLSTDQLNVLSVPTIWNSSGELALAAIRPSDRERTKKPNTTKRSAKKQSAKKRPEEARVHAKGEDDQIEIGFSDESQPKPER